MTEKCRLNTRVTAATRDRLAQLSAARGCSVGEVLDALLAETLPPDAPPPEPTAMVEQLDLIAQELRSLIAQLQDPPPALLPDGRSVSTVPVASYETMYGVPGAYVPPVGPPEPSRAQGWRRWLLREEPA